MTTTRKTRQTGTEVTCGSAHELGLDEGEGDMAWYTICEKHGTAIGHRSKRLATHFAPVPIEWCEFCATPDDWCDQHEHPKTSCECWDLQTN